MEDGAEGAFWEVAGVVGDGGIAVGAGAVPDFMAAGGVAIEREAEGAKAADNFAILETGQPSPLCPDDDHEIRVIGT